MEAHAVGGLPLRLFPDASGGPSDDIQDDHSQVFSAKGPETGDLIHVPDASLTPPKVLSAT